MSSTNDEMRAALMDVENGISASSMNGMGGNTGNAPTPSAAAPIGTTTTVPIGVDEATTNTMQIMAATIAQLKETVERLEAKVTANTGATATNLPAATPQATTLPFKKRLGELTKFDGTKGHYPSWKLEAMSKLAYDGHLMGDNRAQLAYLFMRMEPGAQLNVRSYYNAVQVQAAYTPEMFIAYLDSVFVDPNEAGRALQRLQKMRQGESESFAAFFPRFERTLAEAEMSAESDRTKISFLEGTLNDDTRRAMVGRARTTYLLFAADLQLVGSQLDGLRQSRKATEDNAKSLGGQSQKGKGTANEKSRMGGGNAGAGNSSDDGKERARWVTAEEIRRRKERNLCLRCGREGHIIKSCPLAPAQRPTTVEARKADMPPPLSDESNQGEEAEKDQL